ncbi:MAG: methionyl-tRNA formyltransferase, partial [Nitrospirae bacterium]
MKIVFFGTPSFAVPTFEVLKDNIVLVVTQPDKPAGRGHKLKAPPVKELALKNGIEVLQPQSLKDTAFLDKLFSVGPDIGVVVAYGKIIPKKILDRLKCINLHASLLPKYRGAAPVQWAIINGEKTTGVTTMLMDEGLDTGPILMQEEVEILDEDTGESLGKRLSEIGAQLMIKTIQALQEGTIVPKPQEGQPSYAPIIKKTDGLIDWNLPAIRIHNLVRGLYPWPTAYTYLNRRLL